MSKITNVVLVVVIAILVALFIYTSQQGRQLQQEYDRLAGDYGALPVEDEDQFLVTFKPSEDSRREFLWRVYQPVLPNGPSYIVRRSGGISSGSSGVSQETAKELRVFARFRIEDGNPEFYYSICGSSSVRQFDASIREFVAEHWDQLEFEVLAESESVTVPSSKAVQLFSLSIPEELFGELPEDLSDRKREKYTTKPLMEFIIGDSVVIEDLR